MSISGTALEIWWENCLFFCNFPQLCFCLAWSMLVLCPKSPFLPSQWVIDHMAPGPSLAAEEEGKKTSLDKHANHFEYEIDIADPSSTVSRELAHRISFIKAKCTLSWHMYWVHLRSPSESNSNCLLFYLHHMCKHCYDLLCWEKTFLCSGKLCLCLTSG